MEFLAGFLIGYALYGLGVAAWAAYNKRFFNSNNK